MILELDFWEVAPGKRGSIMIIHMACKQIGGTNPLEQTETESKTSKIQAVAMAFATNSAFYILGPPNSPRHNINNLRIYHQILNHRPKPWLLPSTSITVLPFHSLTTAKLTSSTITCFATDKPSSSPEIRSSIYLSLSLSFLSLYLLSYSN